MNANFMGIESYKENEKSYAGLVIVLHGFLRF